MKDDVGILGVILFLVLLVSGLGWMLSANTLVAVQQVTEVIGSVG